MNSNSNSSYPFFSFGNQQAKLSPTVDEPKQQEE